jgi:hypothetical protein
MEVEVGTNDPVPDMNVNDLVALVVQRRVATCLTAHLDLSSFHLEPGKNIETFYFLVIFFLFAELDAYCFFPLSFPNNLQKVMKCADHFAVTPYASLSLANNHIRHMSCMTEKMTNFLALRSLDLRNNKV